MSFAPYESVGGGTFTGSGVDATLCNVGVTFSTASPSGTAPAAVFMRLNVNTPAFGASFAAPLEAMNSYLGAFIQVAGNAPGVYSSTSNAGCGAMSFGYSVPFRNGSDCEAGTNCNAPSQETFGFQATEPFGCAGGSQPVMGSWTLNLASLTPGQTTSGGQFFIGHGQLIATLVGNGVTDTATLALIF